VKSKAVFLILFLLLIGGGLSAQARLIIATDEWNPYEYTGADGVVTGFSTEVVRAVLAGMNIGIAEDHIGMHPFARLEQYVIDGTVDAAYSLSRTEKREGACYFPAEPIINSRWVLFIRKSDEGRLGFTSFEDLKGRSVGVVRAYAYTPEFWACLEEEGNGSAVTSDEQNFRKLAAGRIDYVAAEYGNASGVIKELGLAGRIVPLSDNPIAEKELYLIFNKRKVSRSLVDDFSDALRAFKSTPEYDRLYRSYFF